MVFIRRVEGKVKPKNRLCSVSLVYTDEVQPQQGTKVSSYTPKRGTNELFIWKIYIITLYDQRVNIYSALPRMTQ